MQPKKLELQELEQSIEIGGVPFTLEAGDVEATAAAYRLFDKYRDFDVSSVSAEEYLEMADEMMRAIEGVIGDGAIKAIFPERKRRPSAIHLINILAFIIEEMGDAESAAVEESLSDLIETADKE